MSLEILGRRGAAFADLNVRCVNVLALEHACECVHDSGGIIPFHILVTVYTHKTLHRISLCPV